MKKHIYIYIITIFLVFFNLIIIIFPSEIMFSVKKGLLLWANFVLPALLPFMISISLLKATPFPQLLSAMLNPLTGKVFRLSTYGTFALVCGMLTGYPLGARLICQLYTEGKLSKKESNYLLSFACNSGPLFVIGTLGVGLIKDRKTGFYLLMIHYISALLIGLIMPKATVSKQKLIYSQKFDIGKELSSAITSSAEAIVIVGTYIIFFSMVCKIADTLFLSTINSLSIKGLLFGILEVTNGCNILASKSTLNIGIISGLVAFGGLSVHSQSIGYIAKAGLSQRRYLLSKILHGMLSFCIAMATYPLIFK